MPLGNYRDNKITLNGKIMHIGGFARPHDDVNAFIKLKNDHQVGAVISLSGDYSEAYKSAGLDPNYYAHGSAVEVYDWFSTPLELTEPIDPAVYDAVYEAVTAAQQAGKKIAIHCGAGDGRTGTALSSLKIRELLEKTYRENPENFDAPQKKTEKVHVHFGAEKTGKADDVAVTPLVKQAIESIRSNDNPGHHSVESPNDVRTLLNYEMHLRAQFALRNKISSNLSGSPAAKEGLKKLSSTHYKYQTKDNIMGRSHAMQATVEKFNNLKEKYSSIKGDHLKSQILNEFKEKIENTSNLDELNILKNTLMKSDEYKVLKTGQGITTRALGLETSSVRAFKEMISEQEKNLTQINSSMLRNSN
ncbi:hypothetical protein [Legionella yabuuchiae]|uniref:phosphatase domain-containing protein n=1 Tax=Legionella yabuuchiae TaxID=376727 RepID=UPI00105661DF|nr:hypothetical protein [Legionella yabuuchiae]